MTSSTASSGDCGRRGPGPRDLLRGHDAEDLRGIRAPGLSLPGKYVGTFHRGGEAGFWSVRDARDNVVIQFEDEEFSRAVLTVEAPAAVEHAINEAVQHRRH